MIATCVVVSVRPATTTSTAAPACGGLLLLRQHPDLVVAVLVDGAADATLRLCRRLGLVEPVVVARIALVALHCCWTVQPRRRSRHDM